MKLSTKSRYGVLACFFLAKEGQEQFLSLTQLSKWTNVSDAYLEQIFAKLKKGNIVESTRGSSGGYKLVNAPSEVTIGEIMRVMEGNLSLVDCLDNGCEREESCPTCAIWRRLTDGINNIANSITLQNLIDDANLK